MDIQGRIASKVLAAFVAVSGLASVSSAFEYEAVPGQYVVKLKQSVNRYSTSQISRDLSAQVVDTIPNANLVVIQRSSIELEKSVVSSLSSNDLVEYVEPNYIYRISKTPNDPSFEKLWGILNVGQTDGKGPGVAGVDVDAEKAWDITTGNQDLVVAVIDTGVNYNHPDLKDNMWTNAAELNGQAGVDDDGNGFVDDIYGYAFVSDANKTSPLDDHGHGSHCSGTIGAKGDDGKGIVGVAWNVKIMAVKFLSASGGGTLTDAVKAIDYATLMGAKIMSNSWGGGGPSQALKEAIERANAKGILFVAAAGNDGSSNDSRPTYPANYDVPNVLSVAAIDNKGNLASFSNFGKRTVHVAAPGVNVYSSTLGSTYSTYSGTSMATPHVSGVAALLASHEPELTGVELKARIMATAKPIRSIAGRTTSGLVSAYNALTNQVTPPDPNDPANWSKKEVSISSPHPYEKNQTYTYELTVDGANEFALFFNKFETESGYDKVTIYDSTGATVSIMSGLNDGALSAVIKGNYAKIVLTSDESVNKYGFDITAVHYR